MNNILCDYYSSSNNFHFAHSITGSPSDKNHPIHHHDYYELYFLISGDIIYYIEGQTYNLQSNDMLIINGKELHRPYFNTNKPYERIVITFYPEYISMLNSNEYNLLDCFDKRKLGCNNRIGSEVMEQYELREYLYSIREQINIGTKSALLMMFTLFIQLLIKLNDIYLENPELLNNNIFQNEKTVQILEYINNNLEDKLKLDDLSKKFFLSKYHLCRMFKSNTGFTLQEYITYKRIIKAKELLVLGKPLSQVCDMVGFGDYSSFLRAFKKIEGCSPKVFLMRKA